MKNLLKLEFRKLKRQRSFYIILAIMLAFTVISALTMKLLANFTEQISDIGEAFGESFNVSGDGVFLGFLSAGNFSLLTAIFVSIVVCDDYESHFVKNIFSRGYSRSDFYFAKLIYLIVATSIMFAASAILSGILGQLLFGISGDTRKMAVLIAVQYLASMAGISMYFAISAAIKKLGGTIVLNIIFPSLVSLLLGLLDTIINVKNFSLGDYWISSFTGSMSDIAADKNRIIVCAVLAALYFLVFICIGYSFNERTEA